MRTDYCHELAVRLLAGALVRSAAKYNVGIKIMFSHSSEHYLRLYATADYGARKADYSLKNMGYINHCFACSQRETSVGWFNYKKEVCSECGNEMSIAGPLWIGKIVYEDFVASMEREAKTKDFKQKKKIRRLLTLTREEANAPITYFLVEKICDRLGLSVPSIKRVVAELEKVGYRTRLTHFKAQGIKTDASARVVKETITKLCK